MEILIFVEEKVHALTVLTRRALEFQEKYLTADSLKKLAKQHAQKFLFYGLLLNLVLQVFSLRFLLSLALLLLCVKKIVDRQLEAVSRRGLISYLSPATRHTLLRRSIFDVLCDLWYYPKISLYVKALLGPFLVKPRPEEAAHQLDTLPPEARNAMLTKGIVYVLPRWLKRFMLPRHFSMHNKVQEFLEVAQSPKPAESSPEDLELPELRQPRGFSFLTETKRPDLAATADRDIDGVSQISAQTPHSEDSLEKKNVIIGSEMLRQMKHLPGRVSWQWDKLDQYLEEKKEKERPVEPISEESEAEAEVAPVKPPPVTPLAMLLDMLSLKKKQILSRVSAKKLVLLILFCGLVISGKLVYSQKYRRLTQQLFIILSYLGVLGVGLGSVTALALKMQDRRAVPAASK